MTTTDLPISGYVAPGFEAVRDTLAAHVREGEDLGAGIAATLHGEIIFDVQAGFADRDRTTPVSAETLFPVFSCSKAVSALVIALLVEEAKLDYDAPVARYWPEFAAEGKGAVTVAEALSHQAGLSGITSDWAPEDWFDTEKTEAKLAAQAPIWPPGTVTGYHPITWGVIAGALARRVDDRSFGTILREAIAGPIGAEFWIGLPESEHGRVAQMRQPRAVPDFGAINAATRAAFLEKWSATRSAAPAIWRAAELPAASGHGTALGLAKLGEIYARGGVSGATRVLGEGVLAEAIKQRAAGPDLVLPYDVAFGVGLILSRPERLIYGPGPRAVGHTGYGGSCVTADPDRRLAFAYVMNQQNPTLLVDARAQRLIAALYDAL